MGRPSKLSEKVWDEIGARLLKGESSRSLGREFKIAESTIRERFSAQHKKIKYVANQIVATDLALKSLPLSAQVSAHNLAQKWSAMSASLTDAGVMNANTSAKMAMLANSIANTITEFSMNNEDGIEKVKSVMALTRSSNEASEVPFNLMRVTKESPTDDKVIDINSIPTDPREAAKAYLKLIAG